MFHAQKIYLLRFNSANFFKLAVIVCDFHFQNVFLSFVICYSIKFNESIQFCALILFILHGYTCIVNSQYGQLPVGLKHSW